MTAPQPCPLCGRTSHGFACPGLLDCGWCAGTMLHHERTCRLAEPEHLPPRTGPERPAFARRGARR